jgi:hypothetical protein
MSLIGGTLWLKVLGTGIQHIPFSCKPSSIGCRAQLWAEVLSLAALQSAACLLICLKLHFTSLDVDAVHTRCMPWLLDLVPFLQNCLHSVFATACPSPDPFIWLDGVCCR